MTTSSPARHETTRSEIAGQDRTCTGHIEANGATRREDYVGYGRDEKACTIEVYRRRPTKERISAEKLSGKSILTLVTQSISERGVAKINHVLEHTLRS